MGYDIFSERIRDIKEFLQLGPEKKDLSFGAYFPLTFP